MKINITAGECLNNLLKIKYPDEIFIPFNEAMNKGKYSSKLFSSDFIKERCLTHNVSEKEYKEKLSGFLKLLENLDDYAEIFLWFGEDDFCKENQKVVIKCLQEHNFSGKIILNVVEETTGKIIDSRIF